MDLIGLCVFCHFCVDPIITFFFIKHLNLHCKYCIRNYICNFMASIWLYKYCGCGLQVIEFWKNGCRLNSSHITNKKTFHFQFVSLMGMVRTYMLKIFIDLIVHVYDMIILKVYVST